MSVSCNKHACAEMQSCRNWCVSVSPLRTVRIPRLHAWEWCRFTSVPPVCHPVSPCVSTSFSFTAVSRVAQVAQGGTRVAHLRIRTVLQGESLESLPFCRVSQLTHGFDKLFNLHMHVVTHVTCVLTFFLTDERDGIRVCHCVSVM